LFEELLCPFLDEDELRPLLNEEVLLREEVLPFELLPPLPFELLLLRPFVELPRWLKLLRLELLR
jgi:hypothetical protein